ncbi:PREDICTED: uncharacterized protein LOC105569165 [Vollenhovia emeryi]|uniref:uncharacterized protein LOC105569165 n=1 Tax=Vollenhovia emeryi TaxID=411798 RepID=UPI0005F4CA82|nr:PREDICTED: uncharacterized protein LOC105569165 [Vollenhovia emeryi]
MKLLNQFLILTTAVILTAGQSIDECLKQDSISCVQKTLYRAAKGFFANDKLELVNGISLVKSSANARSGKALAYDQEMEAANGIAERQNSLENFISDEAEQFFTGRSLRINLGSVFEKIRESTRAISESAPPEIRQAVDQFVEARKKKGSMKKILPLLIAAKVKLGLLGALSYFVIGYLAKKAIEASVISLLISAFIGFKSLWSSKTQHHDVTAYNAGWNGGWSGPVSSGWSSPAAGGWTNAAASGWEDPHAHGQAYSGYQH